MLKVKQWVITKKGNSFEVSLPAHRVVCPTCDGQGAHVNPAVDGHGLSHDDFAEDPDFAEAYFTGRYDVRCEECDGRNVIDEINWDALTEKMKDRVNRQREQETADEFGWRCERRMGA